MIWRTKKKNEEVEPQPQPPLILIIIAVMFPLAAIVGIVWVIALIVLKYT